MGKMALEPWEANQERSWLVKTREIVSAVQMPVFDPFARSNACQQVLDETTPATLGACLTYASWVSASRIAIGTRFDETKVVSPIGTHKVKVSINYFYFYSN